MDIKACIFDLDGVLVDTAQYHFVAWKALAKDLGVPFNHEDNEHLKGVSRMESLQYILNKGKLNLTADEKEMLASRKNAHYLSLCEQITEDDLFPGVLDFFEALEDDKIAIALGSASKNARMILDRLEISAYFKAIADGNSFTRSKPDPEVFLNAALQLKLPAESCLVFEDAVAGIQAANSGGFYSIGVGDEESLWEAQRVIEGFENLDWPTFKKEVLLDSGGGY